MSPPVPCACCDGPASETRYRDQFTGAPLVACDRCGHIQASVLPSPEAIARYYTGRYSQQRLGMADAAYDAVMERRARAQCRFLEDAGVTLRGLRVCDIGCGYGALIQALRDRGAEASGLEYDPACVARCRAMGFEVRQIAAEEEVGSLAGLDLITMSHTLEHVRHVDTFLGRLRAGATLVFIEVPNYSLRLPEQFRDQEGHIHFFNRRSLSLLLQRLRMRPLALGAYGPELSFYWSDLGAPLRRPARRLRRDWFFGAYATARGRGMWTRALAQFGSARLPGSGS